MGTTDNFDTPAFAGPLKAGDTVPIINTASGGSLRGATATAAQVWAQYYQAGGATKTLAAADAGSTTRLDTAAGTVVTLPAATGTGNTYRFLTTVIATSNSHKIQVASATDFMIGILSELSDDTPPTIKGWVAANSGTVATNSDTITMNRSTTGSTVVGEWIEVEDVATATWAVRGLIAGTGTEATPFSAAV